MPGLSRLPWYRVSAQIGLLSIWRMRPHIRVGFPHDRLYAAIGHTRVMLFHFEKEDYMCIWGVSMYQIGVSFYEDPSESSPRKNMG